MRLLYVPLRGHIEHTPGGDAQAGDHRQRHEAQRHERVDARGHAQLVGALLGGLQIAVHVHQRVVGHDTGDGADHAYVMLLGELYIAVSIIS